MKDYLQQGRLALQCGGGDERDDSIVLAPCVFITYFTYSLANAISLKI
jgi:hypothetical protein